MLCLARNRNKMWVLGVLMLGMWTVSTGVLPVRAQAAATAQAHKKNFIQRHPTMTAIAAGIATHHALKVAARNAKAHGKKLNWAERHPTMSAIGVGVVTHHVIKKHTPK